MKTLRLENGMIVKSMHGIEITCNKDKKINGIKSMFQILQSGGLNPSVFSDNLSYKPDSWEDFFRNLNGKQSKFNLHFGKMI